MRTRDEIGLPVMSLDRLSLGPEGLPNPPGHLFPAAVAVGDDRTWARNGGAEVEAGGAGAAEAHRSPPGRGPR